MNNYSYSILKIHLYPVLSSLTHRSKNLIVYGLWLTKQVLDSLITPGDLRASPSSPTLLKKMVQDCSDLVCILVCCKQGEYPSGHPKGPALHPHPHPQPRSPALPSCKGKIQQCQTHPQGCNVDATIQSHHSGGQGVGKCHPQHLAFRCPEQKSHLVSSPDLKSIQSSEHSNQQVKVNKVKDFMLPVCVLKRISLCALIAYTVNPRAGLTAMGKFSSS